MSATDNLLKSAYYKFEWGGEEIPDVKDIDIPTMEYEILEHSNGNNEPRKKSQGIPRFGDLVVKKDMKRGQNTTLYDDFETAQTTPDTGSIKKDAIIFVKNVKDETIWKLKLTGCWVKEYNPPQLVSAQSDFLTEEFVISVDHMEQEA
jgi:phage tail-like protein